MHYLPHSSDLGLYDFLAIFKIEESLESHLIAAQNNTTRNDYTNAKIDKMQV